MKIYFLKVSPKSHTYLGFRELDDLPKNGETFYFMNHLYMLVDIRGRCAFVKCVK